MTVIRSVAIVAVFALAAFAVFAFGNPQWGKAVYMFRAYTLGNISIEENPVVSNFLGTIKVPDNYLGHWRAWHPDGSQLADCLIGPMATGSEIPDTSRPLSRIQSGTFIVDSATRLAHGNDLHSLVFEPLESKDQHHRAITSHKSDGSVLNIDVLDWNTGKSVRVYDSMSIDRRAEFGIAVD